MNSDDFEKRLQDQTFREIPKEWRHDILRAAQAAVPPPASKRFSLVDQLTSLLWPHPKAWAALAGVWMLIGILHFAAENNSRVVATAPKPPSAELVMALREQQRMWTELIGTPPVRADDRSLNSEPRPRSEAREEYPLV